MSGPITWRISLSPSPATRMKRLANSNASSFDFTSTTAQPMTTSFASVNGPSVNLPFESLTVPPLGSRPPVETSVPDFAISSLNFPSSAIFSGVGGALLAGVYSIMKRMGFLLLARGFVSGFMVTSNGDPWNRHRAKKRRGRRRPSSHRCRALLLLDHGEDVAGWIFEPGNQRTAAAEDAFVIGLHLGQVGALEAHAPLT